MSDRSGPTMRPNTKGFALAGLLVLAVTTMLVAGPRGSGASTQAADDQPAGALETKAVPIATAKLFIEYNSTDDDIGVHGAFDDHGWSRLSVFDPNGKPILAVKPQKQLKDLTVAGIFFESREPPSQEFSFEDLKRRFPEGLYQVQGTTFDGRELTGAATFTHAVPAAPSVIFPTEGAVVPIDGFAVEWEDVTATVDGRPVRITGYEIIVTRERNDDPHGFSRPVYDVHVPPDRNRLSVPAEFFEPGTAYELEVLALEESGNQTITVLFFTTQ